MLSIAEQAIIKGVTAVCHTRNSFLRRRRRSTPQPLAGEAFGELPPKGSPVRGAGGVSRLRGAAPCSANTLPGWRPPPGGRSRPPHGVCGVARFPGRCKHRPAGGPGGRLAFMRCHPLPAAMPPNQARQNKAALKGKLTPLPLRAAFCAATLFAGRQLCHGISGKAPALLMDRIHPRALPRLPGRAAQPPCVRRLRPRRQPISR